MSPAGRSLMIVALGTSAPGAMLGALSLVLSDRRSAGLARLATVGLRASATALVAATLVLARAFAVGDYSLVAVADHSRRALGTYDRVMGLWGGMAGSLLCSPPPPPPSLPSVWAAVPTDSRSHSPTPSWPRSSRRAGGWPIRSGRSRSPPSTAPGSPRSSSTGRCGSTRPSSTPASRSWSSRRCAPSRPSGTARSTARGGAASTRGCWRRGACWASA